MTYVCSECGERLDRPDPDPSDDRVSHGLCDTCAELMELALDIEQGVAPHAVLDRIERIRAAVRAAAQGRR